MTFTIWGETYQIRFAHHTRGYSAHPSATYASLDVWTQGKNGDGDWLPYRLGVCGHSCVKGKDKFTKSTGRRLALRAYLKAINWCKADRAVVWEAYLSRGKRHQQVVFGTPTNATSHDVSHQEHVELWDEYLQIGREWEAFVSEGGVYGR